MCSSDLKLKALIKAEDEVSEFVSRIFPNWANVHEVVNQEDQLADLENALRHHLTRDKLASAWAVKERLQAILVGHTGTVIERSEERRVGKECISRWSPYP